MENILKRACWPSFFILPALFFALLISSIEGFIFWWAGLVCLIITLVIGFPRSFSWNPLSIAVVLYIAFLLINIFILSPAFTAKGLYFVCYLAAGFFIFSRLTQDQIKPVFKLTTVVFILLAIWAIFQYTTGTGYLARAWPRVNTIFYTPNTFAAALNLVLLPLIAIFLFDKNKRLALISALLLFGILLFTQSRGGLLAFIVAIAVLWITGVIFREYQADKQLWLKLIAGFIVVFLIFSLSELVRKSGKYTGIVEGMTSITRLGNEVTSGTERLKIYDIAWQRIKEKPLFGHGYNHFQYYQLSDQPLSRKGIITKFVHNDYLQIWMETGIVGLLLLFTVIALFYLTLFKYIQTSGQQKVLAVSLLAGMTAYFTHAMVDFVMYPPVLLLMFGAYLGVTNSMLTNTGNNKQILKLDWIEKIGLRLSVVRIALGLFLIAWLSQPAIAQLAFDQAKRDVSRLDIESALKYFELARRFAPYEPVYYSAEADIWYHAALVTKDPDPARRADDLLARGTEVNPHEVGNLFLRALLHREVPELLPDAASMDTVLSWLEYVMEWHPHDNRVQVEYINTLYRVGRTDEVKRLLYEYTENYPKSPLIQNTKNYYENLLQ